MRIVWIMAICLNRFIHAFTKWQPVSTWSLKSTPAITRARSRSLSRSLSYRVGALDAYVPREEYLARDLPDETVYIFDGTAMLFHAHYSRESRIAHSDTFLSESLSRELISVLDINEEEYRLHLRELLGEAFVPGVSDTGLLHCGALTVMTMNFVRLLRELRPRYVAIAFDAGTATFRNALYKGYKCDRKPAPLSLQPLFRLAPLVMEELGCRCFQMRGYEADDIMASLSDWGRGKGLNVVHVSVDKDMLQLIDTGVHVLNPFNKGNNKGRRVTGPQEVIEKFAVPPENLIDYQALTGDASDGIPGVKGIGPKAGAAILQHFQSLENLIEKMNIPPDPIDFESRKNIEDNALIIDEKLTSNKQKSAAKAIEKAKKTGKKCSLSTKKIYVHIPEKIKNELDACLRNEKLSSLSLYENLLSCGSTRLLLFKQLVTLERNLDIQNTLYDRTKPNLLMINEDKQISEGKYLLSVEKLAEQTRDDRSISETNGMYSGEVIKRAEFDTSQVRFIGERSPLAADVLTKVSASLGTPLNLLRQSYNKLDRIK